MAAMYNWSSKSHDTRSLSSLFSFVEFFTLLKCISYFLFTLKFSSLAMKHRVPHWLFRVDTSYRFLSSLLRNVLTWSFPVWNPSHILCMHQHSSIVHWNTFVTTGLQALLGLVFLLFAGNVLPSLLCAPSPEWLFYSSIIYMLGNLVAIHLRTCQDWVCWSVVSVGYIWGSI